MFDTKEEALEYYDERLVQEMEEEYYDSPAGEIMILNYEERQAEWWDFTPQRINEIIAKIQEKLKYMYQDAEHIDNGDYGELVKQEWDEDVNNLKTDNPDWDEYEDSEDYYQEVQFLQEIDWNDFQENYEDELKMFGEWNNLSILLDKISNLSDDLANIPKNIIEKKEIAMYETISSTFTGQEW